MLSFLQYGILIGQILLDLEFLSFFSEQCDKVTWVYLQLVLIRSSFFLLERFVECIVSNIFVGELNGKIIFPFVILFFHKFGEIMYLSAGEYIFVKNM